MALFNSPIDGAQRFMVKTIKRRTKASLRSSPLKGMSEPRVIESALFAPGKIAMHKRERKSY